MPGRLTAALLFLLTALAGVLMLDTVHILDTAHFRRCLS